MRIPENDPVNNVDPNGNVWWNPFNWLSGGANDGSTKTGPSATFCGGAGCITYQTNSETGTVQWGIVLAPGLPRNGTWDILVYANGIRVDDKLGYQRNVLHASIPSSKAPAGSVVTIVGTYTYETNWLWGLVGVTWVAVTVPNNYIVPRSIFGASSYTSECGGLIFGSATL